jgi:Fe-S-cluster containining protein
MLPDDEHMAAVRRRQQDPELFQGAERRLDAIHKKLRALGVNQAALALQDEPRIEGRFVWLRQIGTILAEAAKGHTPCRAGCAHCCHMATMISQQEAELIARASGRPLATPPPEAFEAATTVEAVKAEQRRYEGKPCPLLKDGQCSVYDSRPFACRIHYSLDRDNLLCRIMPEEIRTPTMNTDRFSMLYWLAHGDPAAVQMADIRAFFPPNDDRA